MINFNNLQKYCPEQQYAKLRKLSQTAIVKQIARNNNTQHSKKWSTTKICKKVSGTTICKKKLSERTIAKDYSEEWFVKLANKKIHKDISKIDTYQEDECKNRFAQ